MFKHIFPILIIIVSPTLLFASESPSEGKWPDNFQTLMANQSFKPIGEATFTVLFWDIYKSNLLTSSGSYPIVHNKEKLVFEIQYLKDISSEDLVNRTIEQWQHIGVASDHYQVYVPALQKLWPDIKENDSLALVFDKQNSAFYYNQEMIGVIDAPNFGQMFIDIWLAPNTSQPKLRKSLLANLTRIK